MRLRLEALVAGKSSVLADGMVRVSVMGADSGQVLGKLTMTVELWVWVKDWAVAADELGLPGIEIKVMEVEHKAKDEAKPETMRGRLLGAVEAAAGRRDGQQAGDCGDCPQDDLGVGKGSIGSRTQQGGAAGSGISRLWKDLQAEKSNRKGKGK